jgi:hypothetical protein
MTKIIYPSDYNDELKAIYDDLYSRGMNLIGKKIKPEDEFLLDLSAKITINQMRGLDNNLTMEQIEEMKQTHKKNMLQSVHDTPPELYLDGLMRTEDGKVTRHPLDIPQEEIFDKTRIPPKDVQIPEPAEQESDDVDITILNTKIDEMLDF